MNICKQTVHNTIDGVVAAAGSAAGGAAGSMARSASRSSARSAAGFSFISVGLTSLVGATVSTVFTLSFDTTGIDSTLGFSCLAFGFTSKVSGFPARITLANFELSPTLSLRSMDPFGVSA